MEHFFLLKSSKSFPSRSPHQYLLPFELKLEPGLQTYFLFEQPKKINHIQPSQERSQTHLLTSKTKSFHSLYRKHAATTTTRNHSIVDNKVYSNAYFQYGKYNLAKANG